MEAIIVYPESKDDLNFLKNFLKRTNMPFTKEADDEADFEFTDEMKRVIDERQKVDKSTAINAWDALKEIRAGYGL